MGGTRRLLFRPFRAQGCIFTHLGFRFALPWAGMFRAFSASNADFIFKDAYKGQVKPPQDIPGPHANTSTNKCNYRERRDGLGIQGFRNIRYP
jgi:hypothetical protein